MTRLTSIVICETYACIAKYPNTNITNMTEYNLPIRKRIDMSFSKIFFTDLTVDSFWESVRILLTKPHVINKRLWGSKLWFKYECKANSPIWKLVTNCSRLEDSITNENIEKHVTDIFNELKISRDMANNTQDICEVVMIELLSKTYTDKRAYQLVFLQKNISTVTFFNVTPIKWAQNICPDFSYSIQLSDQNELVLIAFEDEKSTTCQWLIHTLLPQFIKWGTESVQNKSKPIICAESLALVSKMEYYEKYNYLKLKYGKEMVKIWPECTDASKFVYEDIAITAYLLLLWEQDDSKEKKTFVDLGCGNGLLVYILTKEGHSGVGLDVRKRKIWDMYPPEVILKEKTITPSDISIIPDVDWVIGNHSDELTPWIPVISANISYTCNFFLLPCCAYNFDGSKYQRKNSNNSQYVDYLGYIKQLCEHCGFKTDIDRLKIPSTKRICLVSSGRMYPEEQYEEYCKKIDSIVNYRLNTSQDTQSNFKARVQVERVKNCTQIDKNIVNSIVDSITKYLLQGCSEIDTTWSTGKTADINELIPLISKEQLNVLKSECGGLQTLLKNNHNIFKVQSGKVQLRYPKTIEEINIDTKKRKPTQSTIKIKQKPCWFYQNHPQGCPLADADCSFIHVKS